MRYFNDRQGVYANLAFGELLVEHAVHPSSPQFRSTTTTTLEPGSLGAMIHGVARREQDTQSLRELERNGPDGHPEDSESGVNTPRKVDGFSVTDREELSVRVASDGYVTELEVRWPGKDGYTSNFRFRELSSRRPYGIDTDMETGQPLEYMADFYPPQLLADPRLWQKLYIPAPWRDREMPWAGRSERAPVFRPSIPEVDEFLL